MPTFTSVHQAGRFLWGRHAFGFRENPPADEHANFFRAVMAIANADGAISDSEKSFAKASAVMNNVFFKDFDDICNEIEKGDVQAGIDEAADQLQATDVLRNHGIRPTIYYAALIAGQDSIAVKEREALCALAKKLNLADHDVSHLIDVASREVDLLREKVKLLFPSGSRYHTEATQSYKTIEEACRGYWCYIIFGMTETPSPGLTTAIIRASLSVAAADGALSDEEVSHASAAAIVTGLSRKEFNQFIKKLNTSPDKLDLASKLLQDLPDEFRAAALYYAAHVAATDSFNTAEMEALKEVGTKMGFDPQYLSRIMEMVSREGELHDEKVKANFPRGGPYHAN